MMNSSVSRAPVTEPATMSVENPGDAEVEVNMETLKASLSCPLCNDMFRFPVTVVRARQLSPRSRASRALFVPPRPLFSYGRGPY